jgi:uncharacterized protein (DUF1800 family)
MPLTPYSGTWSRIQAFHLLRRATFGPKRDDVNQVVALGMSAAVAELLTVRAEPTPPLNDYSYNGLNLDAQAAYNTTWVNTPFNNTLNYVRLQSLRGWWIGLMTGEGRNIREKMTLFWTNHLPVGFATVVSNSTYCYEYLQLIRSHSLGNFKDMIRAVTLDKAMLFYLDGRSNIRTAPNENYARELQELFTVGKDLPAHYTEDDVAAAARVLTGWKVNGDTANANGAAYAVYLNASQHDTTNKTFSSFYNNTIIAGQSGTQGALAELDALLNMIFNHNEVANFIIRKLYRFFVYYKITPAIEADIIQPLANTFRTNNYNILPVLQELFTSAHFYEVNQMSCYIKSPIEYFIAIVKGGNIPFQTNNDPYELYRNWRILYDVSKTCQMDLGNPPSVAGWDAYSEAPNYHELWITADTLRTRKRFADTITNNGYNGGRIRIDLLAFTDALSAPGDPNVVIDELFELFHALAPDAAVKEMLKKTILLSNQVGDFYWTSAWTAYKSNPTTTNTNTVRNRLRDLYAAILNMAEAHLA